MNDSVFKQAIDQTFPKLDDATKKEIHDRVLGHLLEYLKEKAYADDPSGLLSLHDMLIKTSDPKKQAEEYGRRIGQKVASLPAEKQKEINQAYLAEMTRVMHEVYQATQ